MTTTHSAKLRWLNLQNYFLHNIPTTLTIKYCYGIVEDNGKSPAPELAHDEQFDLIIDNGTFDAILVEGSVASMLVVAYRMLCDGGIYTVF